MTLFLILLEVAIICDKKVQNSSRGDAFISRNAFLQPIRDYHINTWPWHWFSVSKAVALIFHCMEGLPREMKNWTVSSNHMGSGAENSFPHRRGFWTLFFFFLLILQNQLVSRSSLKSWFCSEPDLSSWYIFSNKSCGSADFLRERNMLGCCGPWWSYPLQFLNSLKYVDLEN